MFLYWFLMAVLIICSAFFSGMEAAVFSISKFRVKGLLFDNIKGAGSLSRIKEASGKTLSTLLLLNDLVNIGASSVAAIIISQILLHYQLSPVFFYVFEIFIMTFILLVFGEITPKIIFLNNAEFFGLQFSFIIEILNNITLPFTKITGEIIHLILPGKKRVLNVSEDDIRKMLVEAKKLKILNETEEQLGYRILKFGKALVEEIMVPSSSVVGLNMSQTVNEAIELMKKTGHLRICVYDNENKVIGVLYAKELVLRKVSGNTSVSDFMRKPFFVQKTKPLDDLLVEFRKKGVHFAVVCDEGGKFLGIVTLNDVFKYLFGEIPGV
uniref:HlyC/CorC family transporter n=1 Tax=candidate division WOR-3 bacterium TaxID=2052148 RepID=A0A7V0Z3K4_UNCW3